MATIKELSDGGPDGTRLGQDADDKVGFYGATPVVQRDGADAVATTATTTETPYGYTTSTQAEAIVTTLNEVVATLKGNGLWPA